MNATETAKRILEIDEKATSPDATDFVNLAKMVRHIRRLVGEMAGQLDNLEDQVARIER